MGTKRTAARRPLPILDASERAARDGITPAPAQSVSLDALRDAVADATSRALPTVPGIRIDADGQVVEADENGPGARLAELSPEAFASRPSLDDVARAVREAQQRGGGEPQIAGREILVDRDGNFVEANAAQDRRQHGVLSAEAFAIGRTIDRTAIDSGKVNGRPTNAGGREGWAWQITTEFGDTFHFFGYWDPDQSLFFTMLGAPRLERRARTPHDLHLYPDGTVCLTLSVGCRDLEHAHTRSALWARGASCYLAGVGFTFNPGQ